MIRRLRWLYPLALMMAAWAWTFVVAERVGGSVLLRWGPPALFLLYGVGVSFAFVETPVGKAHAWSFLARTTALLVLFCGCFGLFLIPVTALGAGLALGSAALIAPSIWILLRYATKTELWQPGSTRLSVGPRADEDARESD